MAEIPYSLKILHRFLKECRKRRLTLNHLMDHPRAPYNYGPPVLTVADKDWLHVCERPWDHTLESIEECAEVAESVGGWVMLEYPVILVEPGDKESGEEVDCGFEVRVWPTMALRLGNDFIEASTEE
jgi:hypothetical protein